MFRIVIRISRGRVMISDRTADFPAYRQVSVGCRVLFGIRNVIIADRFVHTISPCYDFSIAPGSLSGYEVFSIACQLFHSRLRSFGYSEGVKIGYPGINYGLGCTPSHTFRLANISDERVIDTASQNITCLRHIVEWNAAHDLLYTRISSSIIPFASHHEMKTEWQAVFADDLRRLGNFIRQHDMRIAMHPGQFTALNSANESTYRNAVSELQYHADFMDLMGLDAAMATWKSEDGVPLIDYSTQDPNKKIGAHAITLDVDNFRRFIRSLKGRDIDIMLEIKNKEASALQAKLVIDSLDLHV